MISLGDSPFRTSSYSAGNGACVEVGSPAWIKSTYSTGTNNCVEVNAPDSFAIGVRDSKITDSPVLAVSPTAWRAFVTLARS